jgi:hypothetical protein
LTGVGHGWAVADKFPINTLNAMQHIGCSAQYTFLCTWPTDHSLRALLNHDDAVTKARVLHQDVSVGNILITDDRGILIDWELSKWLGLEGLEVEGQKTEHSSSALYDKMRQPT